MEGMTLMLSAMCLNATVCPNQHAHPGVNFYEFLPRDLYRTSKEQDDEMKKLAAEIKGQTLQITTLEDYPLSYMVRENGTLVGKGWAFEFFETLMRKYDFKYNLVMPEYNIIGSSNDSDGSLLQMILGNVRKNIFQGENCASFHHSTENGYGGGVCASNGGFVEVSRGWAIS